MGAKGSNEVPVKVESALRPNTEEEHLGKLSYYSQPESPYDHFPVQPAPTCQVLDLEDLSRCGPAAVVELLQQLDRQGFAVVRVPEAHAKLWDALRASLVPFFDSDEKKSYQVLLLLQISFHPPPHPISIPNSQSNLFNLLFPHH